MIEQTKEMFALHTKRTTYMFRVTQSGHLEHLYYGKRIRTKETSGDVLAALQGKYRYAPGTTNVYSEEFPQTFPETMRLEMSAYGKGDIREPFLEVVHADGTRTSDFLYEKAEITKGKQEYETLPGSVGTEKDVEHVCITLKDRQYGLRLELNYYVYEHCDVITRSAKLLNDSSETVRILRLMSTQLDLEGNGYVLTTFNGAWAREMNRYDSCVRAGKHVNASYTGTSSNRANPFVMIGRETTTEDAGLCFGMNLIYSGNHYEALEADCYGNTRFVSGINPQSFCFLLAPKEVFEAPEAVMTCSCEGRQGMSRNMHEFVRKHIVRGEWRDKLRPVLLNSWEAAYFKISERKLLKLAEAAKKAGIELFVMDDGWFGNRSDDTQSLGDWQENEKKLPDGLFGLCEKIKALGLLFGLWVEPEMVNVKSRLYEAHPDWAVAIPGKPHSEGRNQRILDLTRMEVQDYIIEEMSRVFSSADISYVKWDMNRIFSDYFSAKLSPKRQGEMAHRYVCGLYRVMKTLTERFPHILFEGCSAGGNRFDLGILCYFPQIWASDNTDALCRVSMQTNYSYGYPMSVVSAHVSGCPNHQTLRNTPLETRFHTAAFGIFGYECNLCDMNKEELEEIRQQVSLYKSWREVLQKGRFYRIAEPSGADESCWQWICVSKDGKKAVGFFMQKLAEPNQPSARFYAKGLHPEWKYRFYNRTLRYDIREFGDLINQIAPVHIRQGSVLHELAAKAVKLDGEEESYLLYGDTLMHAGVELSPAFAGTGFENGMRHFPDFASRMYFMEAQED